MRVTASGNVSKKLPWNGLKIKLDGNGIKLKGKSMAMMHIPS